MILRGIKWPSCKGCSERVECSLYQSMGAWGALKKQTRDFPRNKGEENLIIY